MANDWIKMRMDLQTHPKVVRILSATKSDKFRVIGGLHAVWSVFDTHSEDGRLIGYTAEALDHIIGWQGFAQAMIDVGWLMNDEPQALVLPEFSIHNGASAKRRAEDTKRKQMLREQEKLQEESDSCPQNVRKTSGKSKDKKPTREEKRREEVKDSPITPKGGDAKARGSIALNTFLTECKEKGENPIPDDDPVLTYCASIGIPQEFLALQWKEFKDRYRDGTKRYKDWRRVFGNSVRGNWFKLWAINANGEYFLTTTGKQAERANKEAA